MNNLRPIVNYDTLLPEELSPSDEVQEIIKEFSVGNVLKERGMFRLWRMHRDRSYQQIYSDDPDVPENTPLYHTFKEFIADICEHNSVSRATIFSRIRTYEQLDWLEYDDATKIRFMVDKPTLYSGALSKLLDWSHDDKEPYSVRLPDVDIDEDEEGAKNALKTVLDELAEHDSINGALRSVDETLSGTRPEVEIFWNEEQSSFSVSWVSYSVTEDGSVVVEEIGNANFEPDDSVPMWVWSEVAHRLKAKVRDE